MKDLSLNAAAWSYSPSKDLTTVADISSAIIPARKRKSFMF
jgi:hypothetical protein